MTFHYDDVPYDTEANADAHPRSMATLAHLFGMHPHPPSTSRVLEIGCGDGEHLLAAASYLPNATFVGFDLAADAIARGNAAAVASGLANVSLHHLGIEDVAAKRGLDGRIDGSFDYVIAHGIYSWVPETVRTAVMRVIRDALAPSGVAFLSFNALPGWELRRALRAFAREAAASVPDDDAKEKVRLALESIDALAALRDPEPSSFVNVLAAAARDYREHVRRATPPGAPFSRYVFHDLLADENEPFTLDAIEHRAAESGLRVLCEAPLRTELDVDRTTFATASGPPFLQVLLVKHEAHVESAPGVLLVRDLHLWADLTPIAGRVGQLATTTGARIEAADGSALARAAASAPRFVAVADLASTSDETRAACRDLFPALLHGALTLATESAPGVVGHTERPAVSPHVRARAAAGVARNATEVVLTSALHRSFRVSWAELVVLRELDGSADVFDLIARATRAFADAPRSLLPSSVAAAQSKEAGIENHVRAVLDRFARHGFFVALAGTP